MNFYREGFRFVPWRPITARFEEEEGGVEPDLPDHIYSNLLAFMGNDPSTGLSYPALCLVRWPRSEPEPERLKPVSEELARLLKAGMIYPPAIAIARDTMGWFGDAENESEAEVAERFMNALRDELENQRNRPFFLAKSLTCEPIGYRNRGDYCWILRYNPTEEEPLWYVSGDYFAYTCPVTDFDVDVAYLCERFGVSPEASQEE